MVDGKRISSGPQKTDRFGCDLLAWSHTFFTSPTDGWLRRQKSVISMINRSWNAKANLHSNLNPKRGSGNIARCCSVI